MCKFLFYYYLFKYFFEIFEERHFIDSFYVKSNYKPFKFKVVIMDEARRPRKRKEALELIERRQNQYSLSAGEEEGTFYYDKAFIYTFKILDEQIQMHQQHKDSDDQRIRLNNMLNSQRKKAQSYLEQINSNQNYQDAFINLSYEGVDISASINEHLEQSRNQVDNLSKKFESKLNEIARIQRELYNLKNS